MPTTQSGTFNMTTISISSSLEKMGDANNGYPSAAFDRFCDALPRFQAKAAAHYGTEVDQYSAVVMIPAFLDSYTSSGDGLKFFPSLTRLLPNWTIRYSGLSKVAWFRDHFKSVNINHSYKSIYAVGAYSSYSTFMELMGGSNLGFITDATTGNPIPSSMYNVSTVSINESFSPLLGLDVTLLNSMTLKLEYRSTRVLNLSMTSIQLNEATSNDWVVGMGYKINDFNFFGGRNHRAVRGSAKNRQEEDGKQSNTKNKSNANRALNLRLGLSYRQQANITRDIASLTSSASSGNKAFKLSFQAEYTLSKLLTMSFYFDRQTNTPLLSSSSYPTTTQDFGLSMKLSLTR